jgi:hypothetical protein
MVGTDKLKNLNRANCDLLASGNRPAPLIERTDPEIPIVLSRDQMPFQIE